MGTVIGITMSRMIDLRLFEEVTWAVLYYYYYYYLLFIIIYYYLFLYII